MQLVVVHVVQAHDVRVTLALAQELDLVPAVLAPGHDLHGLLLVGLLVAAPAADGERLVPQDCLLQV